MYETLASPHSQNYTLVVQVFLLSQRDEIPIYGLLLETSLNCRFKQLIMENWTDSGNWASAWWASWERSNSNKSLQTIMSLGSAADTLHSCLMPPCFWLHFKVSGLSRPIVFHYVSSLPFFHVTLPPSIFAFHHHFQTLVLCQICFLSPTQDLHPSQNVVLACLFHLTKQVFFVVN